MAADELDNASFELWQIESRLQHDQFYQHYGERSWWMGMPSVDDYNLRQLIGLFLYSPPPVNGLLNVVKASYSKKEERNIEHFAKRVSKNFAGFTRISFVLVCTKRNTDYSVERVMKICNDFKERYIDTLGHEYKTWEKYLKNNKLPKRLMCYPSEGRYRLNSSRQLCLEYGATPALKSRVRNIAMGTLFICFLLLSLGLFAAAATYFSHDSVFYIVASVCMFISLMIIRHLIIRAVVRLCCCFVCRSCSSPDYTV